MDARRIVAVFASITALLLVSSTQGAQDDAPPNMETLPEDAAGALPQVEDRRHPAPPRSLVCTKSSPEPPSSTQTPRATTSSTALSIDARTKQNLTENRVNERNMIRFDSLPFERAIKVVEGDGSRKLAVFTDPDCPYCKRLEEELKSVSNVTMYLFMYPLKNLHPDAERHAKAIWCSENNAQVWTAWVLDRKEPENKTCKDDPVNANLELGKKLNLSGTPTLYFEDGSREGGALPAAELEARMNAVKKGWARATGGRSVISV